MLAEEFAEESKLEVGHILTFAEIANLARLAMARGHRPPQNDAGVRLAARRAARMLLQHALDPRGKKALIADFDALHAANLKDARAKVQPKPKHKGKRNARR